MSKSISAKATVPTKWVVECLSQIARHQDPLAKSLAMLDAILNFKKGKIVFHLFCALIILRELTGLQLAATDATINNLEALFYICVDLGGMASKPWKLQSEQYEMPQRLSISHVQSAVSVHRLTYCLLSILRGQPQRLDKSVIWWRYRSHKSYCCRHDANSLQITYHGTSFYPFFRQRNGRLRLAQIPHKVLKFEKWSGFIQK